MSKVLWFVAGGIVGIALAAVFFGAQPAPRREAVGVGMDYLFHGGNHPLALVESSGRAATACCNLAVISRATEYMATTGSNTQVYRDILRLAAQVDHECPLLADVLDLAVRRRSESSRVLALADAACRIENAAQEEAWNKLYAELDETAEYASVEAALADTSRR